MTATASTTTGVAAPATDPTAGFRRVVTAVTMPVAGIGLLLSDVTYAWATRDGGDDSTGAHALALYGAHPGLVEVATAGVLVGVLALVPAALGILRLVRPAAPRTGLWGAALLVAGYVCWVWVSGSNLLVTQLGIDGVDAAASVDRAQQDYAMGPPAFILFVIGNIVGTAVLGVAVLRTRALPKAAGIGLLAWPVSHVIGIAVGSEWFEVAGATLEVAALTMLAASTLRLPTPTWAARG